MARNVAQASTEYLVVGAGAAGCAFGWLMRQAGHEVLALELHDAQDKEKLCGGILGMNSLIEIARIYGEHALVELEPTRPANLRTRCLKLENSNPTKIATIERKRLDDWLLARYLSAGGAVRDRVRLVGVDGARHVASCIDLRTKEPLEISYGVLVGADGAASAVRRLAAGRHQRLVASLEGALPIIGGDIIFENRLGSQGYCWYIPHGSTANVGCMSYSDKVQACREWLASFCESLGVSLPALKGFPIPTGDDVLLECGKDTWLVGDAAGLASPLSGEGICYALRSARLLAASLLGGTPYEEAMRATLEELAGLAEKRSAYYFHMNTMILRKGTAL